MNNRCSKVRDALMERITIAILDDWEDDLDFTDIPEIKDLTPDDRTRLIKWFNRISG